MAQGISKAPSDESERKIEFDRGFPAIFGSFEDAAGSATRVEPRSSVWNTTIRS